MRSFGDAELIMEEGHRQDVCRKGASDDRVGSLMMESVNKRGKVLGNFTSSMTSEMVTQSGKIVEKGMSMDGVGDEDTQLSIPAPLSSLSRSPSSQSDQSTANAGARMTRMLDTANVEHAGVTLLTKLRLEVGEESRQVDDSQRISSPTSLLSCPSSSLPSSSLIFPPPLFPAVPCTEGLMENSVYGLISRSDSSEVCRGSIDVLDVMDVQKSIGCSDVVAAAAALKNKACHAENDSEGCSDSGGEVRTLDRICDEDRAPLDTSEHGSEVQDTAKSHPVVLSKRAIAVDAEVDSRYYQGQPSLPRLTPSLFLMAAESDSDATKLRDVICVDEFGKKRAVGSSISNSSDTSAGSYGRCSEDGSNPSWSPTVRRKTLEDVVDSTGPSSSHFKLIRGMVERGTPGFNVIEGQNQKSFIDDQSQSEDVGPKQEGQQKGEIVKEEKAKGNGVAATSGLEREERQIRLSDCIQAQQAESVVDGPEQSELRREVKRGTALLAQGDSDGAVSCRTTENRPSIRRSLSAATNLAEASGDLGRVIGISKNEMKKRRQEDDSKSSYSVSCTMASAQRHRTFGEFDNIRENDGRACMHSKIVDLQAPDSCGVGKEACGNFIYYLTKEENDARVGKSKRQKVDGECAFMVDGIKNPRKLISSSVSDSFIHAPSCLTSLDAALGVAVSIPDPSSLPTKTSSLTVAAPSVNHLASSAILAPITPLSSAIQTMSSPAISDNFPDCSDRVNCINSNLLYNSTHSFPSSHNHVNALSKLMETKEKIVQVQRHLYELIVQHKEEASTVRNLMAKEHVNGFSLSQLQTLSNQRHTMLHEKDSRCQDHLNVDLVSSLSMSGNKTRTQEEGVHKATAFLGSVCSNDVEGASGENSGTNGMDGSKSTSSQFISQLIRKVPAEDCEDKSLEMPPIFDTSGSASEVKSVGRCSTQLPHSSPSSSPDYALQPSRCDSTKSIIYLEGHGQEGTQSCETIDRDSKPHIAAEIYPSSFSVSSSLGLADKFLLPNTLPSNEQVSDLMFALRATGQNPQPPLLVPSASSFVDCTYRDEINSERTMSQQSTQQHSFLSLLPRSWQDSLIATMPSDSSFPPQSGVVQPYFEMRGSRHHPASSCVSTSLGCSVKDDTNNGSLLAAAITTTQSSPTNERLPCPRRPFQTMQKLPLLPIIDSSLLQPILPAPSIDLGASLSVPPLTVMSSLSRNGGSESSFCHQFGFLPESLPAECESDSSSTTSPSLSRSALSNSLTDVSAGAGLSNSVSRSTSSNGVKVDHDPSPAAASFNPTTEAQPSRGIVWEKKNFRWIARWICAQTGKICRRRFSINKYGFEGAKQRALDARREAEATGVARVRTALCVTSGDLGEKKASGITWDRVNKSWKAQWTNREGRHITKGFSSHRFGYEGAKQLAEQCRREAEKSGEARLRNGRDLSMTPEKSLPLSSANAECTKGKERDSDSLEEDWRQIVDPVKAFSAVKERGGEWNEEEAGGEAGDVEVDDEADGTEDGDVIEGEDAWEEDEGGIYKDDPVGSLLSSFIVTDQRSGICGRQKEDKSPDAAELVLMIKGGG